MSRSETAPPVVPDYHVSGELAPDSTCNYYEAGTYGGKSYYLRSPAPWSIWWSVVFLGWIISGGPGVLAGPKWIRADENILGDYEPQTGAVGVATVSEGGH